MSESKIDLAKVIFDKVEALGVPDAVKFFNKPKTIIEKWQSGTAQPDVGAAQKVLDEILNSGIVQVPVFENPPQGLTRPPESESQPEPEKKSAVSDGEDSNRMEVVAQNLVALAEKAPQFSLLVPVNRDFGYATVLSLLGQWKSTLPPEIRDLLAKVDMEPDTTAVFARNRLAKRFLDSGSEWSFWMDTDMVASIGNPGWFRRRTGTTHPDEAFSVAALERLKSRNRKLIGGVYVERNLSKHLVCKPSDSIEAKSTAEEIRKGPRDKVLPVDWFGFGCAVVHRTVFEDILEKVPGVRSEDPNQPHEFFTPWKGGNQGEDMAFCERARQAGHTPYLDMSVHVAHVGRFPYMP